MTQLFRFITNSSNTFRVLAGILLAILVVSTGRSEVCVWRDPERTMIRLFPQAHDYETIDRKISDEKQKRIEKFLGKSLDPGEHDNWIFYKIKGHKGETLGFVLTDAEKGEYGVIEIIMGITPNGTINGIYIQRERERVKEFKSREFLSQFVGRTRNDSLRIGKDITANESASTASVVSGVRKMLIMFDELKGGGM